MQVDACQQWQRKQVVGNRHICVEKGDLALIIALRAIVGNYELVVVIALLNYYFCFLYRLDDYHYYYYKLSLSPSP